MKETYAWMIKSPESWWLCLSRLVFDAWDWPDGPLRDGVLGAARAAGLIYELGPSSMSPPQAMAVARRIIAGDYVPEEDALTGFNPTTQRGRDFMNGTGEFAPEQEKPDAGNAEAQA